ncbi:MAG: hypothetical protein QM765_11600 [Myxococcales bacterium]
MRDRIEDAGAVVVLTADEQVRGGKTLPIKAIVDEALGLGGCDLVHSVVVLHRTGGKINMDAGRDDGCTTSPPANPPPASPSGWRPSIRSSCSTPPAPPASPRACSTRTGGYLLHAALTTKWTFDLQGRRHLLVHRRHRLGHRPHLHHLRPAGAAAAPRSSSRACPPIPMPAASGR